MLQSTDILNMLNTKGRKEFVNDLDTWTPGLKAEDTTDRVKVKVDGRAILVVRRIQVQTKGS